MNTAAVAHPGTAVRARPGPVVPATRFSQDFSQDFSHECYDFCYGAARWARIVARLIAGGGALFITRHVARAVTTARDPARARRAGFFSARHPKIKSIDPLPALAVDVNPPLAGPVVRGLVGAVLGSIAALVIGLSTPPRNGFYRPSRDHAADERGDVVFPGVGTFVAGVIPIVLALVANHALAVTFLAHSPRAALAVLIVLMFYRPGSASRRGAVIATVASLVTTTGWFLAGERFGDNARAAVATHSS